MQGDTIIFIFQMYSLSYIVPTMFKQQQQWSVIIQHGGAVGGRRSNTALSLK